MKPEACRPKYLVFSPSQANRDKSPANYDTLSLQLLIGARASRNSANQNRAQNFFFRTAGKHRRPNQHDRRPPLAARTFITRQGASRHTAHRSRRRQRRRRRGILPACGASALSRHTARRVRLKNEKGAKMPGRARVARVSAKSTLRRPPTVLRGPSGTLEAFQRTSGHVPAAFARFPAFLRGNRRFLPAII